MPVEPHPRKLKTNFWVKFQFLIVSFNWHLSIAGLLHARRISVSKRYKHLCVATSALKEFQLASDLETQWSAFQSNLDFPAQ